MPQASIFGPMRALPVTTFLVLAIGVVAAVFQHKPPRRQAHLATLEEGVQKALRPLPQHARLYYRADSGTAGDYGIWCRYFAAPRRLLLSPASSGDTVFYLRSGNGQLLNRFPEVPGPVTIQIFVQP